MRELHEGISQELALLKLKLQGLRAACKSETDQAAYNEASTILHRIAVQAQKLSLGLRPPILDDLGVQAAVRWYLNRYAERFGFAIRLTGRAWVRRPNREIEVACYRVVQEALTNEARHAGAKKVWLGLKRKGTGLQVSIRDDGVGFDAARITKLAPRKGKGGLVDHVEKSPGSRRPTGGCLRQGERNGAAGELRQRVSLIFPPREEGALNLTAVKVLLADDHVLVRAGFRSLLEKLPGIEVVGEAGDGLAALELIKKLRPHVVLMDISMKGSTGLKLQGGPLNFSEC